ncbi:hypothetical protein DB346_00150 [Verrucomicrobia bacterium LW23]|nr:hypothetical protein DB346_00150 [Verrucomicrobia bacterium LW23]
MLEHYSGFCRKPMERPVELNGTFWPMVRDEDVCYQYQYQDIVLTSSDFPPHVASTSQADYPPVSAASPEFRHSDSAPGQAAPCESATPVTGPGFIPPLPVPFGVSTPEVVPPARAASSTSRARPLVHVYRAGLPDRKGTTGKAQKSFGPNPFRRTPPARMGSGTFQTVS